MPEWNPKANDIFVRAVEIDAPADRRRFVEQQCGGDAVLQAQVESLLAAGGKLGSFLEKPAGPAPPPDGETAAYRPLTEGPGTVIGPYKLLQHIGEGGFGAVYMAEQEYPVRRKVALKIIKLGMDTREVIARFESERQALAMMEHPNIARVFDAGATESGRPYFVMELVRGVPITEFCDRNRFSAEQRLKLFVSVCHAIQHAHHKGIIHRDIKPSNVMVTLHDGVPVVKVIDFGVAKATAQKLTERTLFTAYGQMIGTPAYMSPEQAEMSGLDIDMRSDIFSLGVLLYELLTGTTPLDSAQLRKAGYAEMQRLIREEEAPRPSTRLSSLGGEATVRATNRGTDAKRLSQLLRSDLDWIVMKSLEKDRSRRYGSPDTFAADIERYLKDEAVEACPPTLGYRLKKAYRRNKAAIFASGAFAAVLLVATGVSLAFGVRATRSEADAIAARNAEAEQRDEVAKQYDVAISAVKETSAANEKLRVAQDRATRLLYVSRMNHASSALADNRLRQLQQILTEATPAPGEPDLRNWEWHYLDRLLRTDTEHKLEFGSGSRTRDFRVTNHITTDGRWTVRGRLEGDGVVFDVIDTPTGKPVGRIPKAGTLPDVSKGNKDLWHFPVLSTDGRYLLLTEAVYRESKPSTPITRRPRMWEVATGAEVAAPPDPLPREMAAPFHTIEVGPGGEWVTWLDAPSALKGGGSAGPVDVTIHRWEKANGSLPPKTVRVGTGWGRLVLGPDGRTLFWVPQRPNSAPWSGKKDWPEAPYRLEVWDIADAPKPRWSVDTLRPTTGPGYQPRLYAALSPSRTSVAILEADDIAVHSVADGKLLWRTALPEKRPTTSDVGYRVSDDGDRVVCTWDQTIAILDRRASGQPGRPPLPGAKRSDVGPANARLILYRNRYVDDPPADARTGTGRGESLSFHLLPDGKTLVGHDTARGAVRVWDVSPPVVSRVASSGAQIEFVDWQRKGSARSADGRLTARWGGRDEPTAVTLEASGREYGRIELPAKGERAGTVLVVRFLDAGRRVLVTATLGAEPRAGDILPSSKTNQWLLFDIETADRFVKVAEGNGSVVPVPNSRYFWSADSGYTTGLDGAAGSRNGVGSVDIRDARTGRAVYQFRPALPAAVATPGPESFDPTGERVILVTGKAEEYRPVPSGAPMTNVDPERIDVVETATGKRLWGIDLAAEGTNRPGFVRFSPDGRYVLLLGTTPQREAYLSVYSAADGAKLWTADSYARGPTSGTRIIGFSPDGRLVVIGDSDAAEVRDLQSGKRVHRFTGHLDTPDSAVFTPDNSRLFVSFRWVSSARQAQPRLHVWDLTTGRELLTLPSIQQLQRYDAGKLYGNSGVLDGSPVKP